jgi:uncharacterized membrane protein YdbT with pleckstrin-like domain
LGNVHYRMYKFIIDDYAFHLHKGIFFIREVTIPYQQISNVYIGRPYTYRMFGIAQLDIITTADMEGLDISKNKKKSLIPVIDIQIARYLSRHLLENSAIGSSDDVQTKKRHHDAKHKRNDDDDTDATEDDGETLEADDYEDATDDDISDDDFKPEPGEKVYRVIRK